MMLAGLLPVVLEGPIYFAVGLTTGIWTPVFEGDRGNLLLASEILWGCIFVLVAVIIAAHFTQRSENSFFQLLKIWAQDYDKGKCEKEVTFRD